MISSLALTIATCLSGLETAAKANNLDSISSETNDIIEKAEKTYDYSSFDLDENAQSSLAKQKLFAYQKEQGTLGKIGEGKVSSLIESSSDYTYFADLDDMFLKPLGSVERTAYERSRQNLGNTLKSIDIGTISAYKPSVASISTASVTDSKYQSVYGGGGGNGETFTPLPSYEYDEGKIAIAEQGSINGVKFYGIMLSKESCVAMYNAFAKYMNNQAMYAASGIKGPLGTIYSILKDIERSGTVIGMAVSAAIAKVTSCLSSIWAKIIDIVNSLSRVVAAILFIIGAACITIFSCMIIFGGMQKGYALGFFRYSFLNWGFYADFID